MTGDGRFQDAVTLILPCFNESDIFEESVATIDAFFEDFRYDRRYIFVDDESQDETPELIASYVDRVDHASAIYHDRNTGRGRAVTDGIRAADTRIVGFIDIDLEVSIHEIYPLIRGIQSGADVTCGYRQYKLNVARFHRAILSWGYKYVAKLLISSPFNDTEAGCKFFDRERILPVLDETVSDGWFWDTEVMMRAHRHHLEIQEHPVLFIENPHSSSTVNEVRDSLEYLWNLWNFRLGNEGKIR